jgi:hypothetical protein
MDSELKDLSHDSIKALFSGTVGSLVTLDTDINKVRYAMRALVDDDSFWKSMVLLQGRIGMQDSDFEDNF